MNTVSTKPLDTLTAELWDFLSLGPDMYLPALDEYTITRSASSGAKRCTAYTQTKDVPAAIEAVYEYAAYAGSDVRVGRPHESSVQPSGMQLCLTTLLVVAEVPIEIKAILDADAYAEAMASDRREVVSA